MPAQTLTVNGDGTNISGWGAEGGTYAHLQSDDGDTTRLYSPTPNDVRQVALTDTSGLTGVTIDSVVVYAKFRSLDPVSNTFQIGIRTGATDYWSGDKDTVNATTYILFSNTWTTNPNTGVAWTISDLDALQIGVKKSNGVGGAVTYMYAEINYTVGGGATGQMKVYNGTSFVPKPVKVWNGSAWTTKPLKRYDGTNWVITPY